jgi:hypothetical protein
VTLGDQPRGSVRSLSNPSKPPKQKGRPSGQPFFFLIAYRPSGRVLNVSGRSGVSAYTTFITFSACGPLGPLVTSNSTS